MPVLYASSPRRAAGQVMGDVLLVAWTVLCWTVATVIRDGIMALADTGRSLSDRSTSVAGAFDRAADTVSQLPMLGGQAAEPFRQAGDSVRDLAAAGAAQAQDVHQLAWWTFAAVFALPVIGAAISWLPRRIGFARDATVARRFIDADPDVELFALRAMAHQPMHRIARITDDPVGAFRRSDAEVMRELARLELKDAGLPMPARGRRR